MDTIGRRVKAERIRRGLSQEDLAALSGISALTIIRIEQDKSKPRLDTIRKLADALSLPADSLAFGISSLSTNDEDDEMGISEVQAIAARMASSAHDVLSRLRTLETLDTLPVKEKAKVQRALKRQEAHVRRMDRWNATMTKAERKS